MRRHLDVEMHMHYFLVIHMHYQESSMSMGDILIFAGVGAFAIAMWYSLIRASARNGGG